MNKRSWSEEISYQFFIRFRSDILAENVRRALAILLLKRRSYHIFTARRVVDGTTQTEPDVITARLGKDLSVLILSHENGEMAFDTIREEVIG